MGVCDSCTSKNETKKKPTVHPVPFTVDYSRKLGTGIFSDIYAGTIYSIELAVAVKIKKKINIIMSPMK